MKISPTDLFDFAYEYYTASQVILKELFTSPFLYNPCLFLLRQTAELILKALIYGIKNMNTPNCDYSKIKIGQRTIESTHSIGELWDTYSKISTTFNSSISANQQKNITNTVKQLDKIDVNASHFRYPSDKHCGQSPAEPISIKTIDIAPSIGTHIPTVILKDDEVLKLKGIKAFKLGISLSEVIETLFTEYEHLFVQTRKYGGSTGVKTRNM